MPEQSARLSEFNDKRFVLDGQRLRLIGSFNGEEIAITVGSFIPEAADVLAPAIVSILNRYKWLAVDDNGNLRLGQVLKSYRE